MGKEIKFAKDCVIKKIAKPEIYNDLITELMIEFINEKYGKSVVEKRI